MMGSPPVLPFQIDRAHPCDRSLCFRFWRSWPFIPPDSVRIPSTSTATSGRSFRTAASPVTGRTRLSCRRIYDWTVLRERHGIWRGTRRSCQARRRKVSCFGESPRRTTTSACRRRTAAILSRQKRLICFAAGSKRERNTRSTGRTKSRSRWLRLKCSTRRPCGTRSIRLCCGCSKPGNWDRLRRRTGTH